MALNTAQLQTAGWKVVKSNDANDGGRYVYGCLIDGHWAEQSGTSLAIVESACNGHRDFRSAHSNKTGSEVN